VSFERIGKHLARRDLAVNAPLRRRDTARWRVGSGPSPPPGSQPRPPLSVRSWRAFESVYGGAEPVVVLTVKKQMRGGSASQERPADRLSDRRWLVFSFPRPLPLSLSPSFYSPCFVWVGDLVTMGKAKTVADAARRQLVQSHEVLRRAYLYLARNETVSAKVSPAWFFWGFSLLSNRSQCRSIVINQVRHQAALALSSRTTFPPKSIPSRVKNRCIESGRGRGVLGKDIRLCRVRRDELLPGADFHN
jgi:small subunit ribosomal protein S14